MTIKKEKGQKQVSETAINFPKCLREFGREKKNRRREKKKREGRLLTLKGIGGPRGAIAQRSMPGMPCLPHLPHRRVYLALYSVVEAALNISPNFSPFLFIAEKAPFEGVTLTEFGGRNPWKRRGRRFLLRLLPSIDLPLSKKREIFLWMRIKIFRKCFRF